jgi:RNA polymerase sigma-70 factor, ECF subfamily
MDSETVAQILFRDRGKLYGYIWSIVRDPGIAEDVFQDVCLLAIRECQKIEGDGHLLPWFRRVARQRAIDYLRRHRRAPVLLDAKVLDLLEDDWASEDATSLAGLIPALRHCLQKLTTRARQIIKLRYVDGFAVGKVAEVMGAQVDAMYQAIWRIHKTLGKCVEQQMGQDKDAANNG